MFQSILRSIILVSALILTVSGCDNMDEKHKLSIEDRLIYSFRGEDEETREKVARIIDAARENDYREALNDLAILLNTRKVNQVQKKAINDLIRQLRFDMEDEKMAKTPEHE